MFKRMLAAAAALSRLFPGVRPVRSGSARVDRTVLQRRAGVGDAARPATADAEGLRRFLEADVLPWFKARRKELANRSLIREQAFGQSLDPDKLERLGRYEVRLDRKFERTLAMLLRLKGQRL
jgi:hypothetical protein